MSNSIEVDPHVEGRDGRAEEHSVSTFHVGNGLNEKMQAAMESLFQNLLTKKSLAEGCG